MIHFMLSQWVKQTKYCTSVLTFLIKNEELPENFVFPLVVHSKDIL